MRWNRGDAEIDDDPGRVDVDLVHRFLSESSYWARGRSRDAVERSLRGSLCFGVYAPAARQVGFARVVTDAATFAWLCDVFVVPSARGAGLGKWLVECVPQHPDLRDVRRLVLATRDAHELYRRHGGFEALAAPEEWMVRQRR